MMVNMIIKHFVFVLMFAFILLVPFAIAQSSTVPPVTATSPTSTVPPPSSTSPSSFLPPSVSPLEGPFESLCSDAVSYFPTFTSENSLLNISLLIVLGVLVFLSIVYAIGRAFGIESLIVFTQQEYVESIFNIILIMLIAGGTGFVDKSVTFMADLGMTISSSTSPATITSAKSLDVALCGNYMTNGVLNGIVNLLMLQLPIIITSFMKNLVFTFGSSISPIFSFGFSISPLVGMAPYSSVLGTETSIITGAMMIYVGIGLLVILIYGMFPLFLYAGIALRSFPWTRAAGGAMLALFISFYIVFPAILYAFTQIPTPKTIS